MPFPQRSSNVVDSLLDGMQVPTATSDRRMGDVLVGAKRSFSGARDIVDTMMTVTQRRRFSSDNSLLGPMRSALPGELARALTEVNTGFSTSDAQTDQTITMPVFAKPFQQGWQHDYCECMPLFSNRAEPDATSLQMYTIASPQVINFALELGELTRSRRSLFGRAGVAGELTELAKYLEFMVASTPQEFAERWNYLGPMMSFKDSSPYSTSPSARRSAGGQRMLGYSIFNRTRCFNTFSPTLRAGQHMYFLCKEVDVSHMRNFTDPRGQAVVARTTFPARALQLVGFSEADSPIGPYASTAYDPTLGPESFKDPLEGDRDYVARAHRIAQEYRPIEYDEETDSPRYTVDKDESVSEFLRNTPELVYRAYMEGWVRRVGVARHFEGRAPSREAISTSMRSHEAMKLLQIVTTVNL